MLRERPAMKMTAGITTIRTPTKTAAPARTTEKHTTKSF